VRDRGGLPESVKQMRIDDFHQSLGMSRVGSADRRGQAWGHGMVRVLRIIFLGVGLFLVSGCAGRAASPTAESPTLNPAASPPAILTLPVPSLTPAPILSFTPTQPPTIPRTPSPTPKPAILIGAGDIASCGKDYLGDDQTALVLARLVKDASEALIFTAGDNVQGDGLAWEYRDCFGPTWGQFKDRIHPVPGNHDYLTDQAGPYFAYFGPAAGKPSLGYTSYDLGEWHIVALNSNCNEIACGSDSTQAKWLRADLANSAKRCTLLYWHNPRWSSGLAGGRGAVRAFWSIANEFGAEIVVNGHDHDYERFAPQDAGGKAVPDGVREFVAGTGGAPARPWGLIQPNSEMRDNSTWGVLKFSLFPGRYEWEFVPVAGGTFNDSGSGDCH
jgi:hypothetical protein